MAAAGHELLFHSVKNDLISRQDALVCFLHWGMISGGYKCVGIGETESATIDKTEVLPDQWNANQDVYVLTYQPNKNTETHILKVIKMDEMILVHVLRIKDEKVCSMSINVSEFTTEELSTYSRAYKNLETLQQQFNEDIIKELGGGRSTFFNTDRSQQRRHRDSSEDDPLRVPPRHGQRVPPEGSEPEGNPFSIGRGDLDPLAGGAIGGPGHGGMLMDPRRGGRFQDPSVGLPQRLPRGAVPPGARFDPFGPPDLDGRPRPSGSRFGPDPDHLPPPGYDDMFM